MMAAAGSIPRFALVIAFAVILHVGFGSHITPVGVIVDPLVLIAVTGGTMGGRSAGASLGGGCGLATDLIVHTPFGMSMLVLTLVGYLAGAVADQLPSAGRLLRAAIAGVLASAAIGLFGCVGWLMDLVYVTDAPLVRIAIVTGIVAVGANPLLERVMRWALVVRPAISVERIPRPRSRRG